MIRLVILFVRALELLYNILYSWAGIIYFLLLSAAGRVNRQLVSTRMKQTKRKHHPKVKSRECHCLFIKLNIHFLFYCVYRAGWFGRIPPVAVPQAEARADGLLAQPTAQVGTRVRKESLRRRSRAQAAGPVAQSHRNSGKFLFCIKSDGINFNSWVGG